ncbi:hypothetical protein B0F88_10382 [Methylobacter tundripaludum]|uniref:Uncharacterized protein n=1 Tax=Methylobacter tundripaludum TaxID=173365 RepID=A0A2S6H584_9GAMM|nr:hypothetical protein [Methylobacter tundripaludum]PPK72649.1 hypothetical protein B0F88_10382 [Methylobacter tundripaludum]
MEDQDSHYQRMCRLDFNDGAFLSRSIDDIDFKSIKHSFKPRAKGFQLPRIAFLGLYSHLSMTDQRHICKALGFEYIPEIKFGITDEDAMNKLTAKWRDITKEYTKLIVIGNASDEDITELLYKRYIDLTIPKDPQIEQRPRRPLPIFIEHKIPILFESELIKTHPDYPLLSNSTSWGNLVFNPANGKFSR